MDPAAPGTESKPLKKSKQKMLILLAVALPTLFLLFNAPRLQAQSAKKIKASEELVREQMVVISRQLGVTCTTCHNTNNFASSEKIEFHKSKEHMRIVQILLDNGMDGQKDRPKADCYMCHRGKLRPDYIEPFDPMTMNKGKTKSKHSKSDTETYSED